MEKQVPVVIRISVSQVSNRWNYLSSGETRFLLGFSNSLKNLISTF